MRRVPMRRVLLLLPVSLVLAASSSVAFWTSTLDAQGQVVEVQNFKRGKVATASTGSHLTIADVFGFLDYVYMGQPAAVDCDKAYDVDDSGTIGVSDVLTMLHFLFTRGSPPAAPYTGCGADPTEDALSCNDYSAFCDPTLMELPLSAEDLVEYAQVQHVLRRIAYGQTPVLLDRVWGLPGRAGDYIDEQLAPEDIDESDNDVLTDRLNRLDPDVDYLDLYRLQMMRGIYSERQLAEVLTDFWENHFNTNLWSVQNFFKNQKVGSTPIYTADEATSVATFFEHKENEAFRANALGMFEDLLITSATDPTMLIYLDSVFNIVGDPNENFGREVLELHTVGVDNGYDQTDVEHLARVFTGWTVCLKDPGDAGDPLADCQPYVLDPVAAGLVWAFHFDPNKHDFDAKTIFHTLPAAQQYSIPADAGEDAAGGLTEGLDFLRFVATSGRTAEYVSTKLCKRFVSDDPPASLIADCLNIWDETGGDLREVVRTILTSEEFLGEEYRLNKVKTPREYALSTVRAFEGAAAAGASEILNLLELLGNLPFNWKTPDGYPEGGEDLMGSARALEYLRFCGYMFEAGEDLQYKHLSKVMRDRNVTLSSIEGVRNFWLVRMFAGAHDEVDLEIAEIFLSTNDAGDDQPLQPWANLFPERIGKYLAFLASFPQHIMQ